MFYSVTIQRTRVHDDTEEWFQKARIHRSFCWKKKCSWAWKDVLFLKVELPYDPAIPILGIQLDKTIIQKDTCTSVFTAALFTTARTWKQPKCPSIDEWIKMIWYLYTLEYCSATKRNGIVPFSEMWMDLETARIKEVRKIKTNAI